MLDSSVVADLELGSQFHYKDSTDCFPYSGFSMTSYSCFHNDNLLPLLFLKLKRLSFLDLHKIWYNSQLDFSAKLN